MLYTYYVLMYCNFIICENDNDDDDDESSILRRENSGDCRIQRYETTNYPILKNLLLLLLLLLLLGY